MSVGVWEPGAGSDAGDVVTKELLQRFLVLAEIMGDSTDTPEVSDLADEHWVMSLDKDAWANAETLSSNEINALIRFFTLVEAKVAGWDAGAKSPVIPLVKIVKARGDFPAELRKWVKSNTDNRYLPYGSAL